MLPLWIIDLSRDEDRKADFKERIGSLPGTAENWCYSDFSEVNFEDDNWFKDFLQDLVEKGQTAIRNLKSIRPINECCMNVCVLGDATEEFTLKFFTSVAALVKHEKGRLIPGHIHQGINILGVLYVPSDIHNAEFNKRQSVLRCLKELDLQHRVNLAAGYDRVMLYQDTQRRTAKFYPLLDKEQRMDYLLQCLIHLYYVCDETHPLLDANAADDFFFSLGVGSLYYDTNEQDENDLCLVGNSIFNSLKENGSIESFDQEISIFELESIGVPTLQDYLKIEFPEVVDIASLNIPEPKPHPVADFMDKHLLHFFYTDFLPGHPTRILERIVDKIAYSTHGFLERMNDRMYGYYGKMETQLLENIRSLFNKSVSPEVGGLSLIRYKLEQFSESITKIREAVNGDTETSLWHSIIAERIPKRYHDAFFDYHVAFQKDETNTKGAYRNEMKAETTKALSELYRREPTVLSTVGRAFLAGIILVLAIMPVLETISPAFINLGNIKKWSYLWAAAVFLVPITVAYIKHLRIQRKKRLLVNKLIAFHLHDAYARVVNRSKNLMFWFYDRMKELCKEYCLRIETIMGEKEVMDDSHEYRLVLPKTMFNQPVIGGKCCGFALFPDSEMNRNLLSIRGSISRVDKISKVQQYTIVHDFPDVFIKLFNGVSVADRVFKDPQTDQVVTKTDEEIEENRKSQWELSKAQFHKEFVDHVKSLIVPRSDKTIAQRLDLLASLPENEMSFKVFADFCEPNGEFVANDDKEFADIKTNNATMRAAFSKFVPYFSTQIQVSTDDMYRSFLFLTKWRTFDHISPNRILPETELFDRDIFEHWDKPPKSSLLLFALIGNMSAEWYELFSQKALTDVPDQCESYVEEIERRK